MMMFSSYSSTWNVSLFFHPPLEKCIICYSCNCKSSIALYFRWRYVKLDIKSDPMWTKVKSSVKQEISEKYLIFFYLVHTAAFKGFVVKAFSISERRSDFMRIWEKIASRHFCAVKIFSRIFFKIYSNIFNSLSSKVCFVLKIFERENLFKYFQLFACGHFLRWKWLLREDFDKWVQQIITSNVGFQHAAVSIFNIKAAFFPGNIMICFSFVA